MKQLKSLEILNFQLEAGIYYKKELEKAIKELKDLENRSCDNCKHNKEQDDFMIFCDAVACQDGSKMMWHSFTKDFCCNKWEKEYSENL